MQGIIFNLLAERVTELWGEDYWTDLVKHTPGLENPVFVGPKKYPDDALFAIVAGISRDRRIAVPDLLKSFGQWLFPRLAASHPSFVKGHTRARDFLKTVESVVHTEVRKVYDDAYVPKIRFQDVDEQTLLLTYESSRKLCWLAEGLILGAGDFFGERVETVQEACVHHGAPECRIRVGFRGVKE